jgi:hypothetical protein
MKVLLGLIFAAEIIQSVAGIECHSSNCAACWKIGSPGIDIKIPCGPKGECGDKCPDGYEGIHCAKSTRCEYEVDPFNAMFYLLTKRFILAVQEQALVVVNLARVYVESTRVGKSVESAH